MGLNARPVRYRFLALGAATLVVSGAWVVLADSSRPDEYVFGLYRSRWFVLNALLSYALIWLAVLLFVRIDRAFVTRAVLAHAGLFIGILALELPAVLGIFDYRELFGDDSWRPAPELRLRRVSRPHLAWEGSNEPDLARKLGIEAAPLPVSLFTDSHGLRNPVEKENPRVVCAGDSILVASLVRVEETVTERLESALGVQVINVSEAEYSPQEALIRVRATLGDLEGRLVIQFLFEGNDLSDSQEWRAWQDAEVASEWPETGLVSLVLDRIRWASPAVGAQRMGFFRRADGTAVPVFFLYDGQSIAVQMAEMPIVAEALVRARDEIEGSGARYAVVFVPKKLSVLGALCEWPETSVLGVPGSWTSPFAAAAHEACKGAGIPFRDTTPALVGVAEEGRLPFYADDTHLNALGHETLAEDLTPWIQELLSD